MSVYRKTKIPSLYKMYNNIIYKNKCKINQEYVMI